MNVAQLHGGESEAYIRYPAAALPTSPILDRPSGWIPRRTWTKAQASSADYVLLDSGDGGTGETFDWSLLAGVTRPYFLAGGLDPENVGGGRQPSCQPYARGCQLAAWRQTARKTRRR